MTNITRRTASASILLGGAAALAGCSTTSATSVSSDLQLLQSALPGLEADVAAMAPASAAPAIKTAETVLSGLTGVAITAANGGTWVSTVEGLVNLALSFVPAGGIVASVVEDFVALLPGVATSLGVSLAARATPPKKTPTQARTHLAAVVAG